MSQSFVLYHHWMIIDHFYLGSTMRMPISQTLRFLKFPIIQTKPNFHSPVKYCNFIPDFSNVPIIPTKKSGFHCTWNNFEGVFIKHMTTLTHNEFHNVLTSQLWNSNLIRLVSGVSFFLELKFIFNSLFNLHKNTHYWIIDLNYYSINVRIKRMK